MGQLDSYTVPKMKKVEVSDGVLNWFEDQTNFTVGHVDELARKELGLYRDTQTWELLWGHIVDPVAHRWLHVA